MKKSIGLLLLLIIIVSLGSCAAELNKAESAEQSLDPSDLSSENEKIGKISRFTVRDFVFSAEMCIFMG